MAIAFTFPGQGSQKVGMGADLAEASAAAREVFEEVDDALGQNLSKLMREGPEDQLTLTENAQPALMAVSLAAIRVLEAEAGLDLARDREWQAVVVLGHPDYYPRFGFSAELGSSLDSPFDGDSFMALELVPGALDGEDGLVVYPAAFGLVS